VKIEIDPENEETKLPKEKAPEKKSKWWQKMMDIVLVILLIFSIFLAYGFGVSNRFYKLMVVTSGSMSPVFEAGDVIFVVRVDPTEVKVGDIVTFQTMDNLILTHRIVEIKSDGEIITRGDANNVNDAWSDGWKLGEVEAKYVFRIPYLGHAISWLRGIFPAGMNTGAWLTDAEDAEFNLAADTWEVATPTPSESPTESPAESVKPLKPSKPTESETPEPSESVKPPKPPKAPEPSLPVSPPASTEPKESIKPSAPETPTPSESLKPPKPSLPVSPPSASIKPPEESTQPSIKPPVSEPTPSESIKPSEPPKAPEPLKPVSPEDNDCE